MFADPHNEDFVDILSRLLTVMYFVNNIYPYEKLSIFWFVLMYTNGSNDWHC